MAQSDIVISEATNITWTGEVICAFRRAECIVYISSCYANLVITANFLQTIMIKNSATILIKDLKFTHEKDQIIDFRYGYYHYSVCMQIMNRDTCMMQIRNVRNFKMTWVRYISSVDNLYLHGKCLQIEEPGGNYEIIKSTIRLSVISIQTNISEGWDRRVNTEARHLKLNITDSHFIYATFIIDIGGGDFADYQNVMITITRSRFSGISLNSKLIPFGRTERTAISWSPSFSIIVRQDNVVLITELIRFLGSPLTIFRLHLPVFLYRNRSLEHITMKQSNVSAVLHGNTFAQMKQFKLQFQFHYPCNCYITACSELTVMYPMVTIQSSQMIFVGGSHAILPRLPVCHNEMMMLNNHPMIIVIKNTMFQNTDETHQIPVLSFNGFTWLRVSLKGGNTMQTNFTNSPVLILENSDLEMYEENSVYIHSQQMITTSKLFSAKEKVGILLSSNSHILLSNNSKIQFVILFQDSNHYESFSIPTAVPFSLIRITNSIDEAFDDFVNCNILKPETCPGLCFFQFIDNNGRYITREKLKHINTKLQLDQVQKPTQSNFASLTTMNGHFNKCQLHTLSGTAEVTNSILNKTFSDDIGMDATVTYEICLCQPNTPNNRTSWNCNQTSSLSVYHGQKVQLLVTLLGDFKKIIDTYPEVVVSDIAKEDSKLSTRVRVCTAVYSQSIGKPNETHVLHLQTTHEVFREYTLNRYVKVHILPCPPGMIDVGTTCFCNTLLNYTDFVCNITNDVSYKAKTPHRWIGQDNDRDNNTVIIATYCPSFFCNSQLTKHGVTLDDLADDVQCDNNREGIMCSQCLDGKSAVFGSFQCHSCSYGWLALIPLFALAGIVIVVILFTFNLTVLQGSINGIVLYVNILTLMDDFLEEFSVRPLRVPLALINFDLGFTLCFFHGMDEFTKALLLFAFPIFLIAILVAIVIAAVKCNLKIFRVSFIANRSVPVLGTIMLLTYTDLASAVITALRFTKIYDVTSGNYRTVWLYQPELEYFREKHIGLAVIALLVSVAYLIPFTITMLLGDWLRRHIRKLWFSHFMDVLHGAFKWPMGFFFGLRLLLRILLITVSISVSSTEAFAVSIATTVIILRVLQQILQPFKSTEQHEMYLPRHLVRKIPVRFVKLIHLVKKLQPSLLDHLFLENILVLSIVMLLTSKTDHVIFPKVIVNVFLTIAIIQITAIMIYHGYKFFPVPKKAKKCFKNCRKCLAKRARSIMEHYKRNKDRQQAVQHSPVIIYDIRDLVPPAVDESDSESESESGNDSECENKVEMGTTTSASPLQEKLLSKSE